MNVTTLTWDDIGIGEKFVFTFDRLRPRLKVNEHSYYSFGEGKRHRIPKKWKYRVEPL